MNDRQRPSKLHNGPPTNAELAQAARSMSDKLRVMVKWLNEANAQGMNDSEAWGAFDVHQRKPTRTSIPKAPALTQALRVYVERGTRDDARRMLGRTIAMTAMAVVRGKITAAEAVAYTRDLRNVRAMGSCEGDYLAVAVETRRTEPERWKAAYNALALDGDVWPRPDTKRGLRGHLKAMYTAHASDPYRIEQWATEVRHGIASAVAHRAAR